MRAIQHYLPHPRHTETMRIFVTAKPDVAWQTARHYDMSTVPWVRFLFSLRTATERLKGAPSEAISHLGVDSIDATEGFAILDETPGREVVVGSVGQFWHLNIVYHKVHSTRFAAFDEPGWGKLAWAITVEPYGEGSTIAFELRTTATDEVSWKRLQRYYTVIGKFSYLIRHSLMAHLQTGLGKPPVADIDKRPLPGDDVIPGTGYSVTHEKLMEAPPSLVWRYLMQIGGDRAGWYSIDWLDNKGIPSVDHLVAEWTDRQKGDPIPVLRGSKDFFEVHDLAREKYFVLKAEAQPPKPHFRTSWAFVLEPVGSDATRLLVRARMESAPKWNEWLMGHLWYPPVHGLMEAVQLKHIKLYAERDAQLRQPVSLNIDELVL
ncbi:MAG TPA: SRPBCC family protein [Chitinophagaceae bacterium]